MPSIPNLIRPGPLPHPLPQGEGRASTATGCCAAPSPLWGGLGWGAAQKKKAPTVSGRGFAWGVCLHAPILPVFADHDPSGHRQLHGTEAQRLVGGDLVYAVDSSLIRPGPLPHPLPQGEGRASTATGCPRTGPTSPENLIAATSTTSMWSARTS